MFSSHLDVVGRDGVAVLLPPGRHTPRLLALLTRPALVVVQTHHTPAVWVTVGVVGLRVIFNI